MPYMQSMSQCSVNEIRSGSLRSAIYVYSLQSCSVCTHVYVSVRLETMSIYIIQNYRVVLIMRRRTRPR